MKLYFKHELIAERVGDRMVIRTTDFVLLPEEVFIDNKDADLDDFIYWARQRCMPENRIGIKDELARLGLDRYNTLEIIKKTSARLYNHDYYSIDFEEGLHKFAE